MTGTVRGDGRRALLLPGSIGMGHHVMAAALGCSLADRGWQTDELDVMELLGGWEQRVGERVFRLMLSARPVYDGLHFAGFRAGSRIAERVDAGAATRLVPALVELLRPDPPDLVVSIFATAAASMARVCDAGVRVRRLTFCTDLNPHGLWVHEGTDCYLVKSQASAAFVRRFDPEARVVVGPAPVRDAFFSVPDRATARAALGLRADEPCALLMCGAWGLGPLADIARTLTGNGVQTLAVAGRNAKAEQRLREVSRTDDRLQVFGFTERVPELMSAADVVITSPGETCSEARVVGRQLALLDVVPGHGRENLQHELELGDAAVVSTDPDLLTRGVLRVLRTKSDPAPDTDRRKRWEAALDEALSS